jgi:hypothetical protein
MQNLVTVGVFQFVAEAELMQLTLASQGIPAYLANEHVISMDWLLSAAVGGVQLQVARADAEAAERIVHEFQCKQKRRATNSTDQPPLTFACENCGRTITFPNSRAGGVESCPHCGKYVDVPEVA